MEYIAVENQDTALDLNDQLVRGFRMLAGFPNSGHSRKDLAGDRNILFWPVGKYLILYRPAEKDIEILAVLHASRDIPMLLRHRKIAE